MSIKKRGHRISMDTVYSPFRLPRLQLLFVFTHHNRGRRSFTIHGSRPARAASMPHVLVPGSPFVMHYTKRSCKTCNMDSESTVSILSLCPDLSGFLINPWTKKNAWGDKYASILQAGTASLAECESNGAKETTMRAAWTPHRWSIGMDADFPAPPFQSHFAIRICQRSNLLENWLPLCVLSGLWFLLVFFGVQN